MSQVLNEQLRKFYGVKRKRLTLDEAAMLAGLQKRQLLITQLQTQRMLLNAVTLVLNLMAKNGFNYTFEARESQNKVDVTGSLAKQTGSTSKYDVFIDQVIEEVKRKNSTQIHFLRA